MARGDMRTIGLWVLLAGQTGCGGGETPAPVPEAPSCPALRVTIDGEPYAPLTNFKGILTQGAYEVNGFDKPGVTCADLMSPTGYQSGGAISVAASAGAYKAVRFDAATNILVKTEVVKTPSKAGDPVAVCVQEEASWEAFGKQISVVGLFEGSYCGERK